MLNQTPKTIKTQGNGQMGSFHIEWFSAEAMRQKDTPNGQFETPPEYTPNPSVIWLGPRHGWDFPPSGGNFFREEEFIGCNVDSRSDRKNVVGAVCNVQSGTDEI